MSFWYAKWRAFAPQWVKVTLGLGARSRRIDDGLIDQENWNVVPNRVDAAALGALQAFPSFFEHQRFSAQRANQDVEQVPRNHGGILHLAEGTQTCGNALAETKWSSLRPLRGTSKDAETARYYAVLIVR